MNNRVSLLPSTSAGRLAVFALLMPVLTALIYWRFQPWMFPVFYGDDLSYLLSFMSQTCATAPTEIFTEVCTERFRPLAAGSIVLMMSLFGTKMVYYHLVNAAIHAVTTLLVFAIAHRLSRGNMVVAIALALATAVMRLAAYHVTQVIGPVESVTLVFSLGAVYCAIRADAAPEDAWRWGWLALLMAFLAIHTHERFAMVSAWLFGVFLVSPVIRTLPLRRWLALLAGSLAVPAFYILHKNLILKTPFMIGTGGTHITVDIPRILEHARLGILSIFGFNQGAEYLVGMVVTVGLNAAFLLVVVFVGCWFALFVRAVLNQAGAAKTGLWTTIERLRWPIFLLVLAAFLLFPTLLTIHLEQRWLFAPFIATLLVAAWAAGRFEPRPIAMLLVAAMSLASILLDTMIMRHYDRLFFVSAPQFAAMVKRDVVDKSPGGAESIAFIAASAQCTWTLAEGGFFKVYGGAHRPVYCLESMESSLGAALPPGHRIYRDDGQGHLQDVTAESRNMLEARKHVVFDFIKQFPDGRVSNPGQINIPDADGARVLPWDSTSGPRLALTVVSGFTYRFDAVPVPANGQLLFDVGMIHPASFPARAVIRIAGADGAKRDFFLRELTPPDGDGKPTFEPVSLPLAEYAGQQVTIEFAAETPGNDPSGHWIGYVDPRITVAPTM